MDPVLLKRFTSPDETRSFEKGTFEVVRLGGLTVGRASYEPGWKWSTYVGPLVAYHCVKSRMSGWSWQDAPWWRWRCIAPPKILPNGSQTFREQWEAEGIHGLLPTQARQQGRQPRFLDCQLNTQPGKIFGGAMQLAKLQ